MSRYMTGLLVFLGLLGTFWGLIETVTSVGRVINNLKAGGDASAIFDTLREGLAAPLGGMGISFSSSLFGLAGSLVLGFLDLQTSQAQNRFYTDLEDWLSTTVHDLGETSTPALTEPLACSTSGEMRTAIERLREAITDGGSNKAATNAMANLAEAIQGLVHHMRTEQQMIRDWVELAGRAAPRDPPAAGTAGSRERVDNRACYKTSVEVMALARARRERGVDYWPGFVDALATLILGIIFLITVFAVVQFYLSQEVTGKDTALLRLTAQIAQLSRAAFARKDRQAQPRGADRAIARKPRDERKRTRPLQGLYEGLGGGAATSQGRVCGTLRPARRREACRSARSRRSRCSTSRSRRCGASSARLNRRSRQPRKGSRIAEPHRRSRPAAQHRARAAGAGTVTLPVGLLRPPARHPRQPSRHPHRRRSLRVSVGGVLRHRQSRAQARRPHRTRQDRDGDAGTRTEKFHRKSPGCCASTATPTCARSQAAPVPTGSSRPPAPSRWCNTS